MVRQKLEMKKVTSLLIAMIQTLLNHKLTSKSFLKQDTKSIQVASPSVVFKVQIGTV